MSEDVKKSKKEGTKSKEKVSASVVIKKFFTDIISEFKRVTWPSKQELAKQTVVVIVISGIIGLVICGFDAGFSMGHQALMKISDML
ncbi:MAG: preprotein translocase subunit SecE [Clostridiales bacterium]|jgi:preprotein translocase subunit SecE|nr:preprotein translocase subunit SecE [Clostridiales bacterium]